MLKVASRNDELNPRARVHRTIHVIDDDDGVKTSPKAKSKVGIANNMFDNNLTYLRCDVRLISSQAM